MVVEHTFITRLDAEQTMRTALRYLQEHGFENAEPMGFRFAGDEWKSLKVKRGRKATAKSALLDLPQTVHLEWDRGRVNVAASIEIPKKELFTHSQLLISITLALEELLTRDLHFDEVGRQLREIEMSFDHERLEKRRRRRNITIIAVLFFALCIALV